MLKRSMVWMLMFLIVLGAFPVSAGASDIESMMQQYYAALEQQRAEELEAAYKGADQTVSITGSEDFMVFCGRVAAGEYGLNAVLEADLDLSGICGPEAGNWQGIADYNGIFEGNNHVIENLYAADDAAEEAGLFWGGNGVIRNLTLSNVQLSGSQMVGGIASGFGGVIENCTVSGTVTGVNMTGASAVGGIVGSAGELIVGCRNEANVICLWDDAANPTGYAGGILGSMNAGAVSGCINYGSVDSQGYSAGGIVGVTTGTGHDISDCINYGSVKGVNCAGGLIGWGKYLEVNRCGNNGKVEALECAGGLIGMTSDKKKSDNVVMNCYNHGDIALSQQECGGFARYAAGLVAFYRRGSLINCYNSGKVVSEVCEASCFSYGMVGYDERGLYNCCNYGELISSAKSYAFGSISSMYMDNCFSTEGADQHIYDEYNTSWLKEHVFPAEAFRDGTVVGSLNEYRAGGEAALGVEFSEWVQGENGPCFEWE